MIVNLLFVAIITVLKAIFSIMPDIPSPSQTLQDDVSNVLGLVQNVIGLVDYIFTPAIVALAIISAVLIMNAEYIYVFIMWLIKKIPFLGMK